jgi:hypothetical protein
MTRSNAFIVLHFCILLNFLLSRYALAVILHAGSQQEEDQRQLASGTYYHSLTTATLGSPNPDAAIGNALKGLVESPIYTWPPYTADIPLTLEFYYVGRCACRTMVVVLKYTTDTRLT